MLLSRFISQIRLMNHSAAFVSQYAERGQSLSNSLHSKIFAAQTFAQFFKVFTANRNNFNGELFGSTSRHINGLLSSNKQRLNAKDALEVGKALETIDPNSLPQKFIVSILSILRSLKNKNLSSSSQTNLKNSLAQRYIKIVKEKKAQEYNLAQFVNAYFELNSLRNFYQSRIIVENIINLLEKEQGKSALAVGQISFLLHSLSLKQDLSQSQIRLRSIILRQLQKDFALFKLRDIARIAANLNKMNFYDLQNEQYSIVKQLTDRILDNITELQQSSVYDLIRGEHTSKFYGFYKIYEEINKNIFSSINDKGETDINPTAIFRIIGSLSDKINLQRLPPKDQSNFFLFLEHFAEFCNEGEKKGEKKGKIFSNKLQDLVKNNYFVGEQKNKLLKIITKHEIALNLNILYDFTIKGFNTKAFSKNILEYKSQTLQGQESIIKIGIIAHKLKDQDAQVSALFSSVEAKIKQLVSTPEKFILFYRKANRNGNLNWTDFASVYGPIINTLPNPLEGQQIQTPTYRENYIQYILDSSSPRQFNQFLVKYESVLTCEDLITLVNNHLYGLPKRSEYKRVLIAQINKRIYEILQSKNRKWIESVINLLSKYNKFVINGVLDNYTENLLFKLLHSLINKYDILVEVQSSNSFLNMIERYLGRNTKRYNIEHNYKSLIRHLLGILDKASTSRTKVASIIIEQALRLSLLTKKSLENVDIEKLYLRYFQKSRALYIKDSKHTPSIQKISYSSLQVILSNHNLQDFIAKNEEKIIETVKNANAKELAHYLSIYNPTKSYSSKKILSQILNQAIEKIKNFQRIDVAAIFQNAIDRNFFMYSQNRKITEKVIEEYQNRIGNFSLESHIQLIKFIVTQPNLNPKQYYNKLVEYALGKDNYSMDYVNEQLLVRLAGTNYQFKPVELAKLQSIFQRNITSGLYFFLTLQNQYDEANRSAFVSKFVQKYKELAQNKKDKPEGKRDLNINRAYYLYLKKKYPQQTANFQIEQSGLHFERLSNKPRDEDLMATIAKLSGTPCEQLKIFGQDNHIYKVKNCAFLFINNRKIGAFYQHAFVKRAIKALAGDDLTVLCVNPNTYPAAILDYFNKQCPELFNKEEFEITINELKKNIQQRPNKKRSQVVQES